MKRAQIQGFKENPVLLMRFIRWLKSYLFAMAGFRRILKSPCASKENRFPKLNLPTEPESQNCKNKLTPVHGRFCHRTGVFVWVFGIPVIILRVSLFESPFQHQKSPFCYFHLLPDLRPQHVMCLTLQDSRYLLPITQKSQRERYVLLICWSVEGVIELKITTVTNPLRFRCI